MQIDAHGRNIIGGATPNHGVNRLATKNESNEILDSLHRDEAKMKMSYEIKVSIMLFKSEKKGMTPHKKPINLP